MFNEKCKKKWRKLDNTAKIFSLEKIKKANIFRCSIILKEKVDSCLLKKALNKTLQQYPVFKVKLGSGIFWNCLKENLKEPIIVEEREIPCGRINYDISNDYLFRVSYFCNKINLDIFHILTDGLGAKVFLKAILYNYLNLKYELNTTEPLLLTNNNFNKDEYLNKVEKIITRKEKQSKMM